MTSSNAPAIKPMLVTSFNGTVLQLLRASTQLPGNDLFEEFLDGLDQMAINGQPAAANLSQNDLLQLGAILSRMEDQWRAGVVPLADARTTVSALKTFGLIKIR